MCPPFLIINATHPVFQKEKCFLGRTYQWGVCNIEDKENSDFVLLHKLLLFYFADCTIELTDTFAEDFIQSTKSSSNVKMGLLTGLTISAAVFGFFSSLKK